MYVDPSKSTPKLGDEYTKVQGYEQKLYKFQVKMYCSQMDTVSMSMIIKIRSCY